MSSYKGNAVIDEPDSSAQQPLETGHALDPAQSQPEHHQGGSPEMHAPSGENHHDQTQHKPDNSADDELNTESMNALEDQTDVADAELPPRELHTEAPAHDGTEQTEEQSAASAAVARAEEEEKSKPTRKSRTRKASSGRGIPKAEPEPMIQPSGEKNWYILKVQSNREDSIREALERRVAIAGLQPYFDQIIVPIEMVSEFKNGKKRTVKRKLYPGYLVVHMEITEDTWFLVRETPGIGDFTGAGGKPSPMLAHEVDRILAKQEEKSDEAPKVKIGVAAGDRVRINEGTFENFEGDVDSVDEAQGRVTVMINIFGRSTPVELESWQIERL